MRFDLNPLTQEELTMGHFTKTCAAMIGLLALQTGATAATISPAGRAVTMTGTLTQDVAGQFTTVCRVTLYGTTDRLGITFDRYTGTKVSGGPLDCNSGLVLPLRLQADSSNQVTIINMTVDTRLGRCGPSNVVLPWNNATSTAGPGTAVLKGNGGQFAGKDCHASGSLTVSPAIQIK
ncbi:hypothetical protein [Sphingomonas morindae]|uniref:PPE-repeat protein n=1 Tax=Sphingomonas morindae TaxID=1541170 RepID=A0ABY4XCI5_9SPHN|nr:hypothetical protein [Sphingomonas morindae]USI74667.1 hypothetical protein LHA26_18120 [Sphingomonas morindae]